MVLTTKKKNSTVRSCQSTEEEDSSDLRDEQAASGDKEEVDSDDEDASDKQLDDDFTEVEGSDERGNNATDDNALDIMMNKRESRWVLRSRTLFLVMLLLTALGFAIGAVFIVKNQQQSAFEAS